MDGEKGRRVGIIVESGVTAPAGARLVRYDPEQVVAAMQQGVILIIAAESLSPDWIIQHLGDPGQLPPLLSAGHDWLISAPRLEISEKWRDLPPPNKGAKTDKHQTQGKSRGEKAWLRRNR